MPEDDIMTPEEAERRYGPVFEYFADTLRALDTIIAATADADKQEALRDVYDRGMEAEGHLLSGNTAPAKEWLSDQALQQILSDKIKGEKSERPERLRELIAILDQGSIN